MGGSGHVRSSFKYTGDCQFYPSKDSCTSEDFDQQAVHPEMGQISDFLFHKVQDLLKKNSNL